MFERATFSQNVDFSMGTFSRAAAFNGATFAGAGGTRRRPVQFLGTTFDGPTKFGWATFNVDAEFRGATFNWPAQFSGVTFDGSADFRGATLSRAAQFDGVIFREHATFGDATIGGDLGFQGATFEVQRGLTVHTQGQLLLDEAAFTEPVRIEACATVISCNSTLFRAGGDVFVCDTEVSIEDADFAAPSLLAPLRTLAPGAASSGGARLVSVRQAKRAQLTIAGLDLRACRFAGAHGLDTLRLQSVQFASPPSRGGLGRRWSRRQVLAEEHHWRQQNGAGSGWYDAPTRPPEWLTAIALSPSAEEIAATYRELRKARETAKDEPGAADFYYGEMEMRRHQKSTRALADSEHQRSVSRVEPLVLWLYWFVSGYGLRASRALAALVLTIAVAAVPLSLWGFHAGKSYHGYGRAALFALQSSISLLRASPTVSLSASGQIIEIALRLLGPLFFGLALLSLRGRIKR